MAYDYTNIYNTAVRLIDKFGRNVTLRTTTTSGTSFDPVVNEIDTTIKAVSTKFNASEIDGTLIQQNDKKLITYDEVNDQQKIVDDGISYEVINVDTINPGDTKIIYMVQIRR